MAKSGTACPFCHGAGAQAPKANGDCPRCDGTGKVLLDFHSKMEEVPCDACQGAGKVFAAVTCAACGGSGEV